MGELGRRMLSIAGKEVITGEIVNFSSKTSFIIEETIKKENIIVYPLFGIASFKIAIVSYINGEFLANYVSSSSSLLINTNSSWDMTTGTVTVQNTTPFQNVNYGYVAW